MESINSWPGSRWWKCDFHLHTPTSYDFLKREEVTAAQWVEVAQKKGLEVVAVTDHHTGRGIEKIQERARKGERVLTVFPGVEVTVDHGIHLLILFDPSRDGSAITAFLGKCGLVDDGEVSTQTSYIHKTAMEVMQWAAEMGGLCIAAHVNREKGILKAIKPGQALQDLITSPCLYAAELGGEAAATSEEEIGYLNNTKEGYQRQPPLPLVTFSDAHSLEQIGRHFTWIKMAHPDLEGLRLALYDAQTSVIPGRVGFDPNAHAALIIEEIEIRDAKYIGRVEPFKIRFNPWLNTIIGGRGVGKSSLVEFLRVAMRREAELPAKIREEFEKLMRIPQGRDDLGLLTATTQVSVTYRKEGVRFRIQWGQNGKLAPILVETPTGEWVETEGEVKSRFPLRIYSQKQIFELAQKPQALLKIIDDAPELQFREIQQRRREEENRFFSLRAKMRELAAALESEGQVKGELEDIERKLAVFEATEHKDVLKEFQKRRLQKRNVEQWEEGLAQTGALIRELAEKILPEEFDASLFSPEREDQEILALLKETAEKFSDLSTRVLGLAAEAETLFKAFQEKKERSPWRQAVDKTMQRYQELSTKLAGEGVDDPAQYGRLLQKRQELRQRLEILQGQRRTLAEVQRQAAEVLGELQEIRREITQKRREFLQILSQNPHVRIEVIPYGDLDSVEAEFRRLINKEDQTFQSEIWAETGASEEGRRGVLAELYCDYPGSCSTIDFEGRLQALKEKLKRCATNPEEEDRDIGLNRKFIRHLRSLPPEALDRLETWFPEDSLRVIYSPGRDGRDFRPIEQGSAGQKSAAILAFLLSYGEEPMVLDQPEDDLDNQLIYDLIVRQIRGIKKRRQLIIITHNPNIVVNGDAELVLVFETHKGQTKVRAAGGLQEREVREEICRVMEGGREAFQLRYQRILGGMDHV